MKHWMRRLAGAPLILSLVGCFGKPLHSELQVVRSCSEPFEIKADSLRQALGAPGLVIVWASSQKGSPSYADDVRHGIAGRVIPSGMGIKGDPLLEDETVTVTGNIYRVIKGILPSAVGVGTDLYLFELKVDNQRHLILKTFFGLPETDACDFPEWGY